MHLHLRPIPFLLLLAACGGGSGSSAADSTPTRDPGAVTLVLDTATGGDAWVQYQVAAVSLERADGSATANVLPGPTVVTLADPTGAPSGLTLGDVPAGTYTAVHLGLAPGSGIARHGDGSSAAVVIAPDLRITIVDEFVHSSQQPGWLVVGHDGPPPPAAGAAGRDWQPTLSARADGALTTMSELRLVRRSGDGLVVQAPLADDRVLDVTFDTPCTFDDHPGGRDDFLQGLARGDMVEVEGTLRRDGTLHGRRARRGNRSDTPRLLGRIESLRPAEAFVLHVQAELHRGGRRDLPASYRVVVRTEGARIHASDSRRVLTFGQLEVGMLAKVDFTRLVPTPGELDTVFAREVEVSSSAAPMQPQWQGAVQRVDLATSTIVVVPRRDARIVVQGQAVPSVDLHVGAGVPIERRARRGGERAPIRLEDVVPGSDRIWFRGTVTGPQAVDATWLRVRQDD